MSHALFKILLDFNMLKIVKKRRIVKTKGIKGKKTEYLKYKEIARKLVTQKVITWNEYYHFNYGTIAIRNQKSRWGSCSSRGNLNFNYKLALLPDELVDYVVVHELCHLQHMNHGQSFWNLVGETIPEYKKRKQELMHWKSDNQKTVAVVN